MSELELLGAGDGADAAVRRRDVRLEYPTLPAWEDVPYPAKIVVTGSGFPVYWDRIEAGGWVMVAGVPEVPASSDDPDLDDADVNASTAATAALGVRIVDYLGSWSIPEDHAAVGDGAADDTAALAAWAASPNPRKAMEGEYRTTAQVDLSGTRVLEGGGEIVGTHNAGSVVYLSGASENIGTASGTKGARTVTVTSTSGLVLGSLLCLYNPADSSFSPFRTYYRAGEYVVVRGIVSATEVLITQPLRATYSGVELHRIDGHTIDMSSITIRSLGDAGGFHARFLRDGRLGATVRGGRDRAWFVDRCFGTTISGSGINDRPAAGLQYGIVIGNSQSLHLTGGTFHGTRHGITTGGDDNPLSVPCRDLLFDDLQISNDVSYRNGSANTHGNTENTTWRNCRITGGIDVGGRGVTVDRCTVDVTSNSLLKFVETLGGRVVMNNTVARIHVANNGNLIDCGVATDDLTSAATDALSIHLHANDVQYTVTQSGTTGFWIRNRGSTQKVNVLMTGRNVIRGDVRTALARVDVVSGTGTSDYMVFENTLAIPSFTASPSVTLLNGYETATTVVR